MTDRRAQALTLAAVLLGVGAGYLLYRFTAPPAPVPAIHSVSKPEARSPAAGDTRRPSFALSDLDGRLQDVSQWDGRLLVLNFWATWCGPCRHEIPFFVELQTKYAERGLQIVGIAIDTPVNVVPFYDEFSMNYPTLLGQSDAIRVGEAYGNSTGGLPYTVFVSPAGHVVKTKSGPFELEELDRLIDDLL